MIIRKVKVTEYEYQAPINYVAGATEPDIQFQLTDYEIPSGATGRVYVGRSDGTFEYTVATISGNTVTVAPTSSMFSVKGPGAIQVTLYVGNEVVKNFAVPVYVHADLADDSAEAGSDVTGVFRAAEEQALADFQEQAEEIAEEVKESIPEDYTELTEEVEQLNERIDNIIPGLTDDAKNALLTCFRHIGFLDNDSDYYGALVSALYPTEYPMIEATFDSGNHTIYNVFELQDIKQYVTVTYYETQDSEGVVIPQTAFALSGILTAGSSSIIALYNNLQARFTVDVVDWFNVYHINNSINTEETGYYSGYISQKDYNDHHTLSLGDVQSAVRTILATIGDADMAIMEANLSGPSQFYPIPIPSEATTVTVSCQQSGIEFAIQSKQYQGSDHHYEYVADSGFQSGTYTTSIPVHRVNGRANVLFIYTRRSDIGAQTSTATIDILFE